MFLLLFIIVFHELGHLLAASIFNIKSSEIKINIFGGITTYDTNINIPLYKEFLILIAGPIFQILLVYIVSYLKIYINIDTYNKFIYLNKLLLSFNLMPFINLDGGKLLNILFNYFFSFKISFYLSVVASIGCMPFVFFIDNLYLKIIILIFLIKSLIIEITDFKYRFNTFLLERCLNDYNYKRTKIIKDVRQMKRDVNHIFVLGKTLINEKQFLKLYFNQLSFR